MTNMRIWNTNELSPGENESKKATGKSEQNIDFRTALLDKLFSESNTAMIDSALGTLGGNIFDADFSGSDPRKSLMNINVDGIEKVWAEQLKSPLLQFSATTSKSSENFGGLDDMISLTLREQLLRAKKQIERNSDLEKLKTGLAEKLIPAQTKSIAEKDSSSNDMPSADLELATRDLYDKLLTLSSRFSVKPEQILSKMAAMR